MPGPVGVETTLVRLRTRDGVWLDGVMAEPRGRRRLALIWVHGLGSVFSSGQPLIRELSTRLTAAGIGYFKFNNRGHDVVAGRGARLAGAAFERFGASVEDIRTVIRFAVSRGFRHVVLAGHSTGANKVLHYAARARDPRALVPRAWGFYGARRYVSLYRPGQAEDVFPYYRPNARWTALRSVRLPVAAIVGERDEYLDRPPQALIDS